MAQKILLVDDEEDYLNLLRLILTPEGFDVETACDICPSWTVTAFVKE